MKRPILLAIILALILLAWGGLQFQDRRWHEWLASARMEELRTYVKEHPDNGEALIRLGSQLQEAGERDEAERLLRHAVEVAPDQESGWVALSHILTNDQEAITKLSQYVTVNPQSGAVLAELARRYLQLGDITTARDLAERATKATPNQPDGWRSLGDVMAASRNMPEAEKAYRKSLSVKDDNETRLSLVRLLIPLQRYAEIQELCAPLLKTERVPPVLAQQRARALLYTVGSRLYDSLLPEELAILQNQLREVEASSEQLVPEERFLVPYFLGESYLRIGKASEAVPYLERSVAQNHQFTGNLYSLARAYRLSGQIAKADATHKRHQRLSRLMTEMEMYSNRLEQRPDDPETMLRLADTLTEAGDVAQASQLYQRLIVKGQFAEVARRKLQALPPSP